MQKIYGLTAIWAVAVLAMATAISGCGGSSGAPSPTVRAVAEYQLVSQNADFPGAAATGTYVFRSAAEWNAFWNGTPPVTPAPQFNNNCAVAVVNVGDTDFEISKIEKTASGIDISGAEVFGEGTVPPQQASLGRRGPHGPLIATPSFEGEAHVIVTARVPRP